LVVSGETNNEPPATNHEPIVIPRVRLGMGTALLAAASIMLL
jgi:hypothetical protein